MNVVINKSEHKIKSGDVIVTDSVGITTYYLVVTASKNKYRLVILNLHMSSTAAGMSMTYSDVYTEAELIDVLNKTAGNWHVVQGENVELILK